VSHAITPCIAIQVGAVPGGKLRGIVDHHVEMELAKTAVDPVPKELQV
jgi:hypothetical protein